jgi:hypothetical protein
MDHRFRMDLSMADIIEAAAQAADAAVEDEPEIECWAA